MALTSSRENMLQAWKRVKANGGAPGIDGMTIAAFPAFARQHWERIRSSLKERIKEITSRSWGVSMLRRLEELRRYVVG